MTVEENQVMVICHKAITCWQLQLHSHSRQLQLHWVTVINYSWIIINIVIDPCLGLAIIIIIVALIVSKHGGFPSLLARSLSIVWMFCDVNTERNWVTTVTGLDWTLCLSRHNRQQHGTTVTLRRIETGRAVNPVKLAHASVLRTTDSRTDRALHSITSSARSPVAPKAVWQVWRPPYQSETWYGGAIPICWNLGSWLSGKSLKLLPPDVTF